MGFYGMYLHIYMKGMTTMLGGSGSSNVGDVHALGAVHLRARTGGACTGGHVWGLGWQA